MHEYRYSFDDYFITIYYSGKKYRFKVKKYHPGLISSWHLFAKNSVKEFEYDHSKRKLTEVILHGQTPLPDDFLEVLQKEFIEINKVT
jgi:hypothetical protein